MSNKSVIFESPFDTYQSKGVIGEGGSGRVYAVVNAGGQEFALKCMAPERVSTKKLKRFKNEVEFCQRRSHLNVISVVDTGATELKGVKCPFYVMPLYQGTLRTLMNAGIEPDQVLPMFSQLLDGAEAAHLVGVWHRDLKPENVLWHKDKNLLVVADFGIAHFEEDEIYTAVETKLADKLANYRYAAPEQRDKNLSVDSRADIYALGLMLHEMFTGEVIQGTGYTRISSINEAYAYLDDLIELMIQQNPDLRPQSILNVKEELIGRKNKFVALQEYDAKKQEVVPTVAPPIFEPIELVGVDIEGEKLNLKLSRPVPPGWVEEFRTQRGGHSFIVGHKPENFAVNGDVASIHVRSENIVQQVVDNFKSYVQSANKYHAAQLVENAQREEQARREKLERECGR